MNASGRPSHSNGLHFPPSQALSPLRFLHASFFRVSSLSSKARYVETRQGEREKKKKIKTERVDRARMVDT